MLMPLGGSLAPLGANVASSTLIYDTFTGADGTALTAHSIAPTNIPATAWTFGASDSFTIISNKAKCAAEGEGSFAVAYVNAGVADGAIEAEITVGSSGFYTGLVFRVLDKNNLWALAIDTLGARLWLYDRVAGTFTIRAFGALVCVNTTKLYRVVLSGSSITATADGATILTYSSATHATQTRHGLYSAIGEPAYRADNFKISR